MDYAIAVHIQKITHKQHKKKIAVLAGGEPTSPQRESISEWLSSVSSSTWFYLFNFALRLLCVDAAGQIRRRRRRAELSVYHHYRISPCDRKQRRWKMSQLGLGWLQSAFFCKDLTRAAIFFFFFNPDWGRLESRLPDRNCDGAILTMHSSHTYTHTHTETHALTQQTHCLPIFLTSVVMWVLAVLVVSLARTFSACHVTFTDSQSFEDSLQR